MALFRKKPNVKPVFDESSDGVQHFFDHYFDDLQRRGQAAFEQAINQRIEAFTDDLDTALAKSNVQLQRQLSSVLDQKVNANYQQLEAAQSRAMKLLFQSSKALIDNYQRLAGELEGQLAEQEEFLQKTAAKQRGNLSQGQIAYEAALESLQKSVGRMQEQEQQLQAMLEQRTKQQQERIVNAFVENMASVIESYVKEALADQFDPSQQLPGIIKQLEENKQAIVDDINL